MALSSMTGFARTEGVCGSYAWGWELKSLNGKGLDLRLRCPPGWDAVEVAARARVKALARGTLQANLAVRRDGVAPVVRVNEEVLAAALRTMAAVASRIEARPPSLDGILGIKGVIEVLEADESEEERLAAERAVAAGFEAALEALREMRQGEGEALGRILLTRLSEIEELVARAENAPGRQPDAIRARIAEQIAALLAEPGRFDADRLHQEAVLLATRADIREELDRLGAHLAQARKLIREGGPVGRRLDFLAQECNRELNTPRPKSNEAALTATGLDLKNVVEQFREQVQNLE